jgi:predicted RecA/RadA family phage recombinase
MLKIKRLITLGTLCGLALIYGVAEEHVPGRSAKPLHRWNVSAPLDTPRAQACAAALDDGRVVLVGGNGESGPLAGAEIAEPGGRFRPAAAMREPRADAACALLSDGRLLVAGGVTTGGGVTNSAEIYDANSDRWTEAGLLSVARAGATATLLKDGRVLIAGGRSNTFGTDTIEIFDAATGRFAATRSVLSSVRSEHAAVALRDGRVLIAGGSNGEHALDTVDVFDPQTGSVRPAFSMSSQRAGLSATLLLDGAVLFAGGSNGQKDLATAEVYNPRTGRLSDPVQMSIARRNHQALSLPNNNTVVLVGGTSSGVDLSRTDVYVPWQRQFRDGGALSAGIVNGAVVAHKRSSTLSVLGGDTDKGITAKANVTGYATLVSDRPDYNPGMTVTLSGTGWQPGETVRITMSVDPQTHADVVIDSTADPEGNILDSSYVVQQSDVGVTFYVTSLGLSSGRTAALLTFTDGNAADGDGKMTISPTTANVSTSATYTLTFTADNGKDFNAGSQVRVTIPTGWTAPRTGSGAGQVSTSNVSCGAVGAPTVAGQVVTISMTCAAGKSFTLTYATATSQSSPGTATFTTATKQNGGALTDINTQPAVTVSFPPPTKLAVTSINSGSSVTYGTSFSVTVQSQDAGSVARNVVANTAFALSLASGTGALSGTVTGTITAGTSSVTVSGVLYNRAQSGVSITATRTSGDSLTAGTSSTFTVSPAALGITANADSKTYGQTRTYGAGSTAFTSSGLKFSDTVGSVTITASGGTAADAAVGPYTLTPSAATGGTFTASNYTITYNTGTLTVNPATVTASVTASNKVYNQSTAATITQCQLTGVIPGDSGQVSCSATGAAFSDKNVANGKTVTASVGLSGAAAGNYSLASSSVTTTANITARALNVTATASDKVYDRSTAASVVFGDNRISGDVFTISYTAATFASRNVGAWTVSVSGIGLTGTDAGNYSPNTSASSSASITARPITVTAIAATKVYDGNTSSTQVPSASPAPIAGDTAAFIETYGASAPGPNKVMTASGVVNDGNSGNNYSVTFVSTNSGVIATRLTAAARNASATAAWVAFTGASSYRVDLYDTTTTATTSRTVSAGTLTAGFSGLVNGRTYTLTVTPDNGPASNTVSVVPKPLF